MAKNYTADLKKKSNMELKILEEQSRAELFALRFQNAIGSLEKPHRIQELKKKIARILTLLAERRAGGELVQANLKAQTLQAEYKATMEKMEAETEEFKQKIEAQAKAAEEEAGAGFVDPDSLDKALAENLPSEDDAAPAPKDAPVELKATATKVTKKTQGGAK